MGASEIVQLVGLALAAANSQQVRDIVASAHKLIDHMFAGKLITAAEQNVLKPWVDAQGALALAGIRPASLVIEPDPVS